MIKETEPVYDFIGQEIHIGDLIVYALAIAGTSMAAFRVEEISHSKWFDGRASLMVRPIPGSQVTASGRYAAKARGIDFPRNALVITGTDLEAKLLAHFEQFMETRKHESF